MLCCVSCLSVETKAEQSYVSDYCNHLPVSFLFFLLAHMTFQVPKILSPSSTISRFVVFEQLVVLTGVLDQADTCF